MKQTCIFLFFLAVLSSCNKAKIIEEQRSSGKRWIIKNTSHSQSIIVEFECEFTRYYPKMGPTARRIKAHLEPIESLDVENAVEEIESGLMVDKILDVSIVDEATY